VTAGPVACIPGVREEANNPGTVRVGTPSDRRERVVAEKAAGPWIGVLTPYVRDVATRPNSGSGLSVCPVTVHCRISW
jgi:hypothetical protein